MRIWAMGLAAALAFTAVLGADARAQSLDAVVTAAAERGFRGVVQVASADGVGAPVVTGDADLDAERAFTGDEVWPWASVTKQVTAVLVMQEVERGRLSLDARIVDVLPDFAGPSGSTVTVRQLLQHTSGLPNPDASDPDPETGAPSFYLRTPAPRMQSADALGYCAGEPTAEPGERFEYNNCDYLVLGAMLERLTRRSFAALIEARIAEPAGLASLRVAPRREPARADVVGYDGTEATPDLNERTFGAGGALIGTAADLLRFDLALAGGALLSAPSLETLWAGDPALGYVALGAWSFPAPLAGCDAVVQLVERRGAIGGVQVRNLIAPELGRALVVFTNDGAFDFGEIWMGSGLTYDLASAAFCNAAAAGAD